MFPLLLRQAVIKERDSHEIVLLGDEAAFFINKKTDIVITEYKARGLRTLEGKACRIHIGDGFFTVVGSVAEVAERIRLYLEDRHA